MKILICCSVLFLLIGCQKRSKNPAAPVDESFTYDSHVHIMSPYLISYWKSLGIPFSKANEVYANIDTIIHRNGADMIDLIGMGYVYTNPEYYEGDDAYDRLKSENDYVIEMATKYSDRVRPFFAIDPLHEYALDEFIRCSTLDTTAGLKLHFSTSQVYLTEPEHLIKVKELLFQAATDQVPVLLHFDNWHPRFGRPDLELLVDSILVGLPSLDLRIAHFGTSGGFNQKTKDFIDAYIDTRSSGRIPARHTIKLDISAVALDNDSEGVSKLTDEEFDILRRYIDKIGMDQIVFGTDYPLYTSSEYLEVLKRKLGFTESDISAISK